MDLRRLNARHTSPATTPLMTSHLRILLSLAAILGLTSGCEAQRSPAPTDQGPTSMVRVRPSVKLIAVETDGLRKMEAIGARVEKALPDLTDCYQRAAARLHPRDGRLIFAISIYENGTVESAKSAASQIQDRELHRCFEETLRELTFGVKPRAGVTPVALGFDLKTTVEDVAPLP